MTREERLREKMMKKFQESYTAWLDYQFWTKQEKTDYKTHEEFVQDIANKFAEDTFYKVVELYKLDQTTEAA